jgi:tape measure domain-containing protein
MNVIDIIIKATDTASQVLQGVEKQTKSLKQAWGAAVGASKTFAMGLTAVGVAAGGVIGFGTKIAADLETARQGFITLLGSANKADEILAQIKKDAASTPFELPGLIQANQLLTSVTKDGFRSEKMLLNVGKALAAMGKGQPELDRIIVNLQQIGAVGKASAMDIKQFAFAGIPIYEMLTEVTGKSGEAIQKMVTDGEISFEMLEKMFNDAGMAGGRFATAFTNQAGTFNQLWSNMKDVVSIMMADIVKKTGIFDTIKDILGRFINFMGDHQEDMVSGIKAFIELIKNNAPIVIGIITGGLAPAVLSFVGKMLLVGKTLSPWMVIFTAISFGVQALVKHFGGWEETLKKLQGVIKTIDSHLQGHYDLIGKVAGAIVVLTSTITIAKKANEAYKVSMAAVNATWKAGQVLASGFVETLQIMAIRISRMIGYQRAWAIWTNISTIATKAWGVAVAVATSPVTWIVVAILAFVAAIVLLYKKNEAFRNFINTAWTNIKNYIVSAWESIQDAIKVAWENYIQPALTSFWDFMANKLWPAIRDVGLAIGNFLKPILTAFGGAVSTVVWPALQSLWKTLSTELWPAIRDVGKVIGSTLWPALKQLWNTLKNELWPALKSIGDAFAQAVWPAIKQVAKTIKDDLWPALKSAGELIAKTIWPALKQLATTIWGALKPAFEALVTTGKTLWNALKEIWKAIAPQLLPVLKVIGVVIVGTIIVAIYALAYAIKFVAKIIEIWAKVFAWLIRAATPVITFVVKAIAWYITNMLVPAIKILATIFKAVFEAVAKVVKWAWNTVIEPIWKLVSWYVTNVLIPQFKMIWSVVKVVWEAISTAISWAWNNVIKPIWDIIWAYVTNILIPTWQKIWDVVKVVWNGISTAISWAWNNVIKPIWDLVWAYITNVLVPTWKKIWDIAQKVWDGISTAVTKAWEFIKPIWDTVYGYITNTLIPTFQKIWNKVSEVFTSVKNIIASVISNVKEQFDKVKSAITTLIEKVKGIKDKVMEVFNGVKKWLFDFGKNLVQGFIDGIKSMLSKVGDVAKDIGNKAKDGVKNILKINSPAKAIVPLGEGTVEGYILGVENMLRNVTAVSKKMVDPVVNVAKPDNNGTPPPYFPPPPPPSGGSSGTVVHVHNEFHGDMNFETAEAVDEFFDELDRQAEYESRGVPTK